MNIRAFQIDGNWNIYSTVLSSLTKKTHLYKNVRAVCIIGFCEENQIISFTKGQYYNVLLGKVLVAIEEMITYVAFALISWDHI